MQQFQQSSSCFDRKAERHVKERQEATSSECSPMAKPKPMIRAKARPINLVSHSPLSARENPPQNLRDPVNQGNVDEGQCSQTSTRQLVRTYQSQEVEYSQLRRMEYTQHLDSWKQSDREEPSNSTGAWELMRAVNTRTEFQKIKYTNHHYMTKDFHFFAKEVGNYSKVTNMCT